MTSLAERQRRVYDTAKGCAGDEWRLMMEAGKKKVTLSMEAKVYDSIKSIADELGMTPHGWMLYTLGSAAASHQQMRAKMTDQMVALMASAIAEGVESGELPK